MKTSSNGTDDVCQQTVRTSADPETGRATDKARGTPAAAVPTREA